MKLVVYEKIKMKLTFESSFLYIRITFTLRIKITSSNKFS
nr:MAG TPA: hypothetical protein [Caudoviricetes sp.]